MSGAAGASGGITGQAANNSNDSDDRHSFALAFKLRQTPMCGNFESDSLNENFSPSRPNIRRKRKFKRMAVEYETTPSTPHTSTHQMFPISGTVSKKRVLKHNQENFRSNLFFGKRKRPHRERYEYYESYKHSSSVPRQRGYLSQKDGLSYLEYKSRNRASSMSTSKGQAMEKIMPLNKSIVSKIEKISQDSRRRMSFNFTSLQQPSSNTPDQVDTTAPVVHFQSFGGNLRSESIRHPIVHNTSSDMDTSSGINATDDAKIKIAQKSGSFESALPSTASSATSTTVVTVNSNLNKIEHKKKVKHYPMSSSHIPIAASSSTSSHHSHHHHHHHPHHKHHKQSRRRLKMQLQFEDHSFMDCSNFNEFLSSSSLSSSDSETEETNESDHEGDDELTDWPGHEAMINFASKNEFKRANNINCNAKKKLPLIRQHDDVIQDDDTLMSADEIQNTNETSIFPHGCGDQQTPLASNTLDNYQKFGSGRASHPINIIGAIENNLMQGSSSTSGVIADCGYGSSFNATSSSYNCKQPIESEMSGRKAI